MNKKDIIEIYRSKVEKRREFPPESCWEEIKNRLDIEEAWDVISMELDRVLPVTPKKNEDKRRILVFRLAAVAASLLLFALIYTSEGYREETSLASGLIQETVIPDESQLASEPEVDRHYNIAWPEAQRPSGNLAGPAARRHFGQEARLQYNIVGPEARHADGQEAQRTGGIVALEARRAYVRSLFTEDKDFEYTAGFNYIAPEDRNFADNLRKFSAGVSVAGKNTWLLSEETFDGLSRNNLISTKANFLNDFGIILRYSLNDRWSFEGSGFISSHSEQTYKQYLNGLYSDKTYELRYSSLELTAGRSLTRSFSTAKIKFNAVSGAYISYLHSAYKVLNSSHYNISKQYKPVDYGIILGTDIEIPLLKNFALMPGLRFKYGIPNIFAGQFPNDLRTTRNASLEFRLGLMFQMKKF